MCFPFESNQFESTSVHGKYDAPVDASLLYPPTVSMLESSSYEKCALRRGLPQRLVPRELRVPSRHHRMPLPPRVGAETEIQVTQRAANRDRPDIDMLMRRLRLQRIHRPAHCGFEPGDLRIA